MTRQRERNLTNEFFNIPNTLTLVRIALIPLILVFMALDFKNHSLYTSLIDSDAAGALDHLALAKVYAFYASVVYSVAAITDFLDGWLARNFDMQSILGKFMDPVADKILVMAVGVMLVEMARLPAWLVIVLLTREISITALRLVAESEGLSLDVDQTGKWKTAFQMIGLMGLIVHYRYPTDYLFWQTNIDYHVVGVVCVGISLFFSIFSAVGYFRKFILAVSEKYKEATDQ